MSQLNISESNLSTLGFAMIVEATRVEGEVMQVSKTLWLEIAERLMNLEKERTE